MYTKSGIVAFHSLLGITVFQVLSIVNVSKKLHRIILFVFRCSIQICNVRRSLLCFSSLCNENVDGFVVANKCDLVQNYL